MYGGLFGMKKVFAIRNWQNFTEKKLGYSVYGPTSIDSGNTA